MDKQAICLNHSQKSEVKCQWHRYIYIYINYTHIVTGQYTRGYINRLREFYGSNVHINISREKLVD